MSETKRIRLAGRAARANAVNLCTEAPEGWFVEFQAPRRTLPQNDHIHPLVRKIAKAAGRTDEDTVRLLLVEQWRVETGRPPRFARSLDGSRMVDVSNSTKELEKPDAREFIDWLYAWGATHGVDWDDEHTRAKEPAERAA